MPYYVWVGTVVSHQMASQTGGLLNMAADRLQIKSLVDKDEWSLDGSTRNDTPATNVRAMM